VEGEKKRVKGGGREEKSQRWRERRKESKVEGEKKRVKVEWHRFDRWDRIERTAYEEYHEWFRDMIVTELHCST
jgi:hypothetical protein